MMLPNLFTIQKVQYVLTCYAGYKSVTFSAISSFMLLTATEAASVGVSRAYFQK